MSGLPQLDQIELHAAFSPSKAAIVLHDRVYTYKMLADGVLAVSAVLHELHLDRTRPVGILISSQGRHLIVLLALLRNGFAFASLRSDIVGAALAKGVDQVISDEFLPPLPGLKTTMVEDKWFARNRALAPPPVPVADNQIVQIRFSSGSTGVPKAYGRTAPVFQKRIALKYQTGEAASARFLTTVGLSGSALTYVMRVLMDGNTVYFAPQEYALGSMFAWGVQEGRASAGQARELLAQRATLGYDVKFALLSVGAATLSIALEQDLRRTFGCEIINTYASTEGGVMALAAGDVLRMRSRKGNCFVPLAQFQIVDDEGRPAPVGAEGHICVKHDMASRVFEGDIFEHRSVAPDGWITTGDLGVIDEDGFIIVRGRANEVINLGGVKLNPEALEDLLRRNPATADAAVVRVAGPEGEDEAWLASPNAVAPGALNAVNEWIARTGKGEMAGAKITRILQVDRIPLTAAGKVARAQLRTMMSSKP